MMLVDCCVLCCQGGWTHSGHMMAAAAIVHRSSIAFYLAILPRHTHHNSAKPISNHMPTTYPTKYLRQYLADEDI